MSTVEPLLFATFYFRVIPIFGFRMSALPHENKRLANIKGSTLYKINGKLGKGYSW
jgi:hypothetical protein